MTNNQQMATEKNTHIKRTVQQFIKAANEFNVNKSLAFFAKDAVIEDASVGDKFKNTTGIRRYIETYFLGYKTITKIDSLKIVNANYVEVKVDFTGNFGHETGSLHVTTNKEGLISKIDADLD
jgi:ketosteroid isomerase-like protein